MIHTDAGYYTPVTPPSGTGDPSFMHIWYLKDHLGNNRVLADGSGNALKVHHYGPFGEQIAIQAGGSLTPFPAGSTESPYKYGGKEWNATTSTYDFEARQMAPAFHRFTSMDPLCEKYYSISPYAYCANNPVNLVDFSGWGPLRPAPKSLLGTAAYYQWRNADYQSRHPGMEHSYYISYGYANAVRFESIPRFLMTEKGLLWKDQVELGLQQIMEDMLTSDNSSIDPETFENQEKEFLDFAFGSHVKAYMNESGVKLTELPISDLVVIASTPKLSDIVTKRGIKQVAQVMNNLRQYWADNPDIASARIEEGAINYQYYLVLAIFNSIYQFYNALEVEAHNEPNQNTE